jgi:hypothetical protein
MVRRQRQRPRVVTPMLWDSCPAQVASRLYKGCGSEGKYANASNLGRLVLLMAAASDVELDAGVVAQQA